MKEITLILVASMSLLTAIHFDRNKDRFMMGWHLAMAVAFFYMAFKK